MLNKEVFAQMVSTFNFVEQEFPFIEEIPIIVMLTYFMYFLVANERLMDKV